MRVYNGGAHAPSVRLLVRSLITALSLTPITAAWAGDLDDGFARVQPGDPVEEWRLINDSLLEVLGGEANTISAQDTSRVYLERAIVNRSGTSQHAVSLNGDAGLQAISTTFRGGGIHVNDRARVHLVDSQILVAPDGMRPGQLLSIGVDMAYSAASSASFNGEARIDSTLIRVADTETPRDIGSGLGLRMTHGQADLINGSRIEAANVGALLWGTRYATPVIRLGVDGSTVESGRGAAIRVAVDAPSVFDITVANDSQLRGGDGNLLLVNTENGATLPGESTVNFTVDDARLAGNVRFDAADVAASVNVVLRNSAQIDGRFINVTSADIGSESTWLMTGDSTVGRLTLGAGGTVALGNGTAFNTLRLDTFTGNGGTLLFNTQLGDDSALTDRLVIAGDASGQANVRVLNAGGAGAKTDRGIELIDIGGASNAQFDLVGRAVGGQYEYFLVKDANGNWYLRSELTAKPDPCVIDPSLPECTPIDPVDPIEPPPPILRPETGAYLANQFALDRLLRHTYRDRQGDAAAPDGIRGWARVESAQSRLGAVDDQLDLRVHRSRLQLGADIGVFDDSRGRIGVMGTAARSSATSRSDITGFSARGKVEGGALGVYGNWASDALYVDASVQRGQFRNRVQGDGLAEERYDADLWQSSLEAGYGFDIGQIGTTTLRLQPEVQLVYTDARTDRHEEDNGTVVRSLGDSGLSGRLGVRLQGQGHSTAGASVSPYLLANWYRDGANDGMAFDDEVLKAGIPRNRYELKAGARLDFRSGLSAWGGLGLMRGHHGYREVGGSISVSYAW